MYSVYLIYLKNQNHRNTKGVLSFVWALPINMMTLYEVQERDNYKKNVSH